MRAQLIVGCAVLMLVMPACGSYREDPGGGGPPGSVRPKAVASDGTHPGRSPNPADQPTPVDVRPTPRGPNLVVINTDDQRGDTMKFLPKIRQWMGRGGTRFPNAYVTTPSCCPSRASLMSGRYVHNNQQYQQLAGGFDITATSQRYLHDAGYFTGHAGKFLHWLDLAEVSPYWDRWTYLQGDYTDVPMNFDGTVRRSDGNSTEIVFDRAIDYVDDFSRRQDERPFYLQLTPIAPHGPSTAEPQYADRDVPEMKLNAAQREVDRTDKPVHVQNRVEELVESLATRTDMIRTLYTVDDEVDRFLRHLKASGELRNTLVIFTSDNGYLWGEHGLRSKFRPYPASVEVPFYLRWPGMVSAGMTDPRRVAQIDVLPTLLAAARVDPALVHPLDGQNILSGKERARAYTEYYFDEENNNGVPTWASIRTDAYQYVEYYQQDDDMDVVSFREYYDMTNDPDQLVNLLADGIEVNNPDVGRLSALLRESSTCRGRACR
ncbi:MAG: sulfatase-like hydrolase/transferase [Nocardioides sp.]